MSNSVKLNFMAQGKMNNHEKYSFFDE